MAILEHHNLILERYNKLIERQKKLRNYYGSDVSPSDISKLNIVGKKMITTRNFLTCIKGSDLEIILQEDMK